MPVETSEPSVSAVENDSCGKRPVAELGTPETAKKSKLDIQDVAQVKKLESFDPTFGAGSAKKPDADEGEECENEEEADEVDDESEIEDDGDETNEDATANVLEELIAMFKEQNGRDPTENEIKMWMDTLKESMNDALGEEDDRSKESGS
jgi:hypothetical protein